MNEVLTIFHIYLVTAVSPGLLHILSSDYKYCDCQIYRLFFQSRSITTLLNYRNISFFSAG